MKVFFDIVGCRLNQSEVEQLATIFRSLGHEIVGEAADADLAIINTCAVTVSAAADSRKKLRRTVRQGASRVVATGCWATLYPDEAKALAGVSDVIGNPEKDHIPFILLDEKEVGFSDLQLIREPLPGERARTRAFIKVQEGCDNHCTYCLTRLARGRSRSRTIDEIIRDISIATAGGTKEIVLTGVQLGAWGRDLPGSNSLKDLLNCLLIRNDFQRLRLSSIEPWDFDFDMIVLWRDKRLCRHLHIPLQSGNDRILKRMGRPITVRDYQVLIDHIRENVPEIAITTDMIVGFPNETEEDFEVTLGFVQKIGFSGGHAFTYSLRPGTAAFQMEKRVPISEAKKRNAALRHVFFESGRRYIERFLGTNLRVLWESSERLENGLWRLSGLTDNYIRVYAETNTELWNEVSSVKMVSTHESRGALFGSIM